MIQVNNMQLRNLLEQVYRNKEDIKYILTEGRQFDEFGIKVVGQVSTVDELPDPVEYHTAHGDDSYGDAYMVGTNTPYTLYILTREFSGTTGPHWFDVGEFPLQGPQGDKGDTGHSPDVSIKNGNWYIDGVDSGQSAEGLKGDTGNGIASIDKTNTSGLTDTYTIRFTDGTTTKYYIQNGAQGQRGEQGVPGNAVSIIGIINTEDELPTPTEDIRNNAYLLNKGNNVYDMYIILGESTLVWTNVGEFNSGTQVTVGGSNVATFNADTKVNHIDNTSGIYRVYIITPGNNDATTTIANKTNVISNGSIAGYAVDNAINDTAPTQNVYLVSQTPVRNYHAATKKYVDDKVVASDPITTEWGGISLKYGGGLTTNNGYLEVQAGNGITTENSSVELSSNVLNYPGLYSQYGSYLQDNYGNLKINGSEEIEVYSKNHEIYNDNFGFMITPDGIILGTYSSSTGEIDKTMPYIEITSTAVNIKGLNSIT